MTVTHRAPSTTRISTGARRFGYLLAAGINLALLLIVNNVLAWGWFPWLTDDFEDVLPVLSLSLVVAMLVNMAWVGYDAAWFKAVGNIAQGAIALVVSIRLLGVFPFDFSAYAFNWGAVARGLIIVAIVGSAIAILAESAKLLTGRSDW